jgi:3-hydroxypropanoate dehydrogenase
MSQLPPVPALLALAPAAQDLLFREARTANTFTDEPVTEEQVRALYELVKFGPTMANSQPLRVLLVRSPEARARLVPHMSGTNAAKTATAPLVAVLAFDSSFHEHFPQVLPYAPGMKDRFADPAMRDTAGRPSAWLQAGYFLVGIRAAGLAAGPMGGFDATGVDREFFPDGRLKTLLVVNIGKPGPDAWRERLPRLSYEQAVSEV